MTLIYIYSYGNAVFLTKIKDLYKIKKSIINNIYYQLIIALQSSSL